MSQEFERYPALASWIERLGNTAGLALGEWMVFVGSLNHALSEARQEGARGGEPVALGAYRSEFLRWRYWCRDWSESAFLAGEPMTKEEVSDNTSQLYSDLCRLGIHLDTWAHEALASPAEPSGWRPVESDVVARLTHALAVAEKYDTSADVRHDDLRALLDALPPTSEGGGA